MPVGPGASKPYVFRPPRHDPFVMALARAYVPLYLRRELGVVQVRLEPGAAERLAALRGQRVVLTPNHPSYEPPVLFQLSTQLGLQFNWLAAREVFEIPVQGWVVARVGAYSIDRGTLDGSALNATRQLIAAGRNWLVLFPEGQEHYLHDFVLPFLPGAARLGYGALEDLAGSPVGRAAAPAIESAAPPEPRTGPSAPPPTVLLLPLALRYYYLKDMRREIEALLSRLEQRLGLADAARPSGWHLRMFDIASRVLGANEGRYGIQRAAGEGLQARLDRVREAILRHCAAGLGAPLPPAADEQDQPVPLRNRIRKLFTAANAIIHAPAPEEGGYARELDTKRREQARELRTELRRVLEFVAMTGDYSAQVQTQERFMDVLGRLELEVFGKLRFVGPRAVAIAVGEPQNLADSFAQYQADPAGAAEAAMQRQEQAVRSLLDGMAHYCTPLPAELAGPLPE